MRRLTQIFAVLLFLLVFLVAPQNKAQADVYGYILKISVFDSNREISNGNATPVPKADALANQLRTEATVYDPSNPQARPAVAEWSVSIESYDSSGRAIATSGGTWSFNNINSTSNQYKADLKLVDGNGLNGYYFVIKARAKLAGKETNESTFEKTISDEQIVQTPLAFQTSSNGTKTSGLAAFLDKFSGGFYKILDSIGIAPQQYVFVYLALAMTLILLIILLSRLRKNQKKQNPEKISQDKINRSL